MPSIGILPFVAIAGETGLVMAVHIASYIPLCDEKLKSASLILQTYGYVKGWAPAIPKGGGCRQIGMEFMRRLKSNLCRRMSLSLKLQTALKNLSNFFSIQTLHFFRKGVL
jgi:hypothetical protein